MAARSGIIGSALRDPITPLLLSLACAVAFAACGPESSRRIRPAVVVWWSIIAGTLLFAIAVAFFQSAPRDVYPVGDGAILEIYTLHALRGVWTLGPYSQFGWHHPGPLYFYLLAPLYALSGEQTIGMHVGAFVLNLLSLCAVAYTLIRYAAPGVACAGALALGFYLFRLPAIIPSYWNPHIVVLPAAAYLVLSAAVAAGRHGAMPAAVLVGSFLVQTHISLAPYVLVLGGAVVAAAWYGAPSAADEGTRRWWIHASTLLLAVLWLFPVIEQASHSPGNVTRVMRFFGEPSPGQDLRTALIVWGDMICALFQRQLEIPAGLPLTIPARSITIAGACAILQLLLLAVASLDARRRHDRFHTALTAAGLLASVTALWSITRVKSLVGDYTIFWLSAIGALNWAVITGLALTRVAGVRLRAVQRWAALGASAFVVCAFVYVGSGELKRARRQGLSTRSDSARRVRLATEAILGEMKRQRVERPLFQMSTNAWGEAAGVLLQVYKRGVPPAVDASLVSFFGEPLARDGREDRLFIIADATRHATLKPPPGDQVIANLERMYIHTSPIVSGPSMERRTR